MKANRITIKGKVHDVGYRLFLMSEAERLLIEKFDARNVLINGEQHLIVLIEGAEEKIDRFVAFAESNYPPAASVESVEVHFYEEAVRSIDAFRQSFMVFQLTKIAQAGVGMLGKQDVMLGKQDVMLGKMDVMIEKQDVMIEKQDAMLGKQDVMIEKQDAMLGKQDAMLGKQDAMLGKQDVMIEKQDETIEVIKEESEKTRKVVCDEGEKTREVLKEKIGGRLDGLKRRLLRSRELSIG